MAGNHPRHYGLVTSNAGARAPLVRFWGMNVGLGLNLTPADVSTQPSNQSWLRRPGFQSRRTRPLPAGPSAPEASPPGSGIIQQSSHEPSSSPASGNETRRAGVHYIIQPPSCLNPIDFFKRVLRKRGDVEILFCASRRFRRRKQSRAALHCPGKQYLCGRLSNSRRDSRNYRIFHWPRPHSMAQWRKCQKNNAFLLTELQ